jgi:hypothetical protein
MLGLLYGGFGCNKYLQSWLTTAMATDHSLQDWSAVASSKRVM